MNGFGHYHALSMTGAGRLSAGTGGNAVFMEKGIFLSFSFENSRYSGGG
jgi:hypothetical protein